MASTSMDIGKLLLPKEDKSESIELNKLDDIEPVRTPANEENQLINTEEASEDIKETEEEQAPKETKEAKTGITKHVLTYVANGNWIDANGKKWAREKVRNTDITNVREYTDEEYQAREDLMFMVKYGSLTITTVSL